jgi:hypothetical protein
MTSFKKINRKWYETLEDQEDDDMTFWDGAGYLWSILKMMMMACAFNVRVGLH